MRRWNTENLREKPIDEASALLWKAFESLAEENLFECIEEPTQEEVDHAMMVMAHTAAHFFRYVLSIASGNVRECIAKSWITVLAKALQARRIAEVHELNDIPPRPGDNNGQEA